MSLTVVRMEVIPSNLFREITGGKADRKNLESRRLELISNHLMNDIKPFITLLFYSTQLSI